MQGVRQPPQKPNRPALAASINSASQAAVLEFHCMEPQHCAAMESRRSERAQRRSGVCSRGRGAQSSLQRSNGASSALRRPVLLAVYRSTNLIDSSSAPRRTHRTLPIHALAHHFPTPHTTHAQPCRANCEQIHARSLAAAWTDWANAHAVLMMRAHVSTHCADWMALPPVVLAALCVAVPRRSVLVVRWTRRRRSWWRT